ncbi:MAG: GNAT family N-acetyltransferase [Desulfatiglandales bacterium]
MGNLNHIFDPKSIALIGASDKEDSPGGIILRNLLQARGRKIFPVNPHERAVMGLKCVENIESVGDPVDLAVMATPAEEIPELIEACGRAGIGGAVIISSGFREIGEAGRVLEQRVAAARKRYGMRILGPNSMGFLRPHVGLNTTLVTTNPRPGGIAFISQSRALGSAILDWAMDTHVGFSMFASLGSMIDVDFGDLIDFLGEDYDTKSILLYMEGVGDAKKFMSASRAFALRKPIIVLKPGRFTETTRAGRAYTGAIAGDDAVYEAAFKRVGVVRVKEIADLFDTAEVLDFRNLPRGHRLAIVTAAGGPGVMAADTLIDQGGELARLSEESMERLNGFLPPLWSKGNPLDVLGDADAARYGRAIQTCLNDPGTDGVLVIYVPMDTAPPDEVAAAVIDIAKKTRKPIVTAWMGGEHVRGAREMLTQNGIPSYGTPEKAVRAYANMYRYKRNRSLLYETPAELPVHEAPGKEHLKELVGRVMGEGRALLTEEESKQFLAGYGIPTAEQTVPSHVEGEVTEEVTAQKTVKGVEYELILGSKRDKDFGAVIFFGMGGANAELIRDFSIGLPPLNQTLAKRLMEDTKAYRLIKGWGGRPPADLEELETTLVNFSNLIVDFPEIREIDINPLAVSGGKPWALDAKIILDKDYRASPYPYPHFIITPYPTRFITPWRLADGTDVLLRPIRPEDEPLEREFLSTLSNESRRTRFFSSFKNIPHQWLVMFCNIDYDRHVAIVAEIKEDEKRKIIGVARLMLNPDFNSGEIAALVHDKFQRKGVGQKLMESVIEIGRWKGVREIHGDVLTDNENMLALCKKLGFETKTLPRGLTRISVQLKQTGSLLQHEGLDHHMDGGRKNDKE